MTQIRVKGPRSIVLLRTSYRFGLVVDVTMFIYELVNEIFDFMTQIFKKRNTKPKINSKANL